MKILLLPILTLKVKKLKDKLEINDYIFYKPHSFCVGQKVKMLNRPTTRMGGNIGIIEEIKDEIYIIALSDPMDSYWTEQYEMCNLELVKG